LAIKKLCQVTAGMDLKANPAMSSNEQLIVFLPGKAEMRAMRNIWLILILE